MVFKITDWGKTMEKDIFTQIHFETRADVEFILSLNVLNQWTDILKYIKSNSLISDRDCVSLISGMYNKIHDDMKNELDYLDRDILWGIVSFAFLFMKNKSVEDLLTEIRSQHETSIIFHIVQSYLYNNVADEHVFRDIANYRSDIGAMLVTVRKAKFQKKSIKQKLIGILENYDEFKKTLYRLLSTYYFEIYKEQEEKINACLDNMEEKYRSLFQKDPEHFVDFYLKYENFFESEDYSIHVSYFAFNYYLLLNPDDSGKTLIILGYQADKNFLLEKADKDKLQRLFKILADKTRFDIICALNGRPYFTQELADKFSLAPSTVNYHLSAMLELDIVTIGRENHRVYYALKKDVFENLIGNSLKIMI